ncbi:UDP-GalNAc:beta-1,3-N-acetylgalactosaminyltransferase 2 [Esox lucius]|uniref:Hexosyltransferase n=1 Tax=Esox lucius TaxID=8010 RepID=A0A3P8YSK1_ESOLU|nr:UDP-GalNAc:beta-1,3-N-acetylgalactosaminyltransferase 2 [Esox lucius]
MRSLALLLIPCVVAVVLHLWFGTNRSSSSSENNSGDQSGLGKVMVGVVSARQHYDQRQAIRQTWGRNVQDQPLHPHRMQVKFIIGKHGCSIPVEDREDPYSCSLLNLTGPVPGEEEGDVEAVRLSDPSVLTPGEVSSMALDFKVLHPVVITRLGAFPSGAHLGIKGNVTVRLLQLEQQEAVVTALFSSVSPGTRVNGIWYKPVEQFILPKGFEGSLVWESRDSAGLTTISSSIVQLNTGGGVLKFFSISEGTLPHRSALGFPGVAGGFMFRIYDMDVLSEVLRGRVGRFQAHGFQLQGEDRALEQESLQYGDMVFVDVVDTYRNVPSKLLQFYKWSLGNAVFDLLLKTDDDCYIDVDQVLMKIDQKGLKRQNFWWGNFRQSWAVDRVGKWQELEYTSPAYPAFACGSGYVASRDLVRWLASNAENLKAYQGEDVSMGIWMAAVGPQKYQDSGWLCEKECYQDMLSSPQLSPQELRSLWDSKRACGDPCGCPSGPS